MSKSFAKLLYMSPLETIYRSYRVSYGFHLDECPSDQEMYDFILKWVSHGHVSPLKQSFIQIACETPVYISRQLSKHQIGMAWNEISRRYTDKRVVCKSDDYFNDITQKAMDVYEQAIKDGIPKEEARQILPQSMIVEWVWCGSALSFANLYWQRSSKHSQSEAGNFVTQVMDTIANTNPLMAKLIVECGEKIRNF